MYAPERPSKSSVSSKASSPESLQPRSRFTQSLLINLQILRVDLAAMLEKKVDHTQSTVEEMRGELLEVKDDLRYTNQLLESFY